MPPKPPIREIRELLWGFDGDQTCFYALGHLDKSGFLNKIKAMRNTNVPKDARAALTEGDVTHTRYRPMSPSECRGYGVRSGVTPAKDGQYGYAVTEVIL